jgi:hypothetical protein
MCEYQCNHSCADGIDHQEKTVSFFLNVFSYRGFFDSPRHSFWMRGRALTRPSVFLQSLSTRINGVEYISRLIILACASARYYVLELDSICLWQLLSAQNTVQTRPSVRTPSPCTGTSSLRRGTFSPCNRHLKRWKSLYKYPHWWSMKHSWIICYLSLVLSRLPSTLRT